METEIQDFWQNHPCGAELVGDLSEKSKQDYEDFFVRYDKFRYEKEVHILKNLDQIDFQGKKILEIGLGQGADAEQIIKRGGIYSGVDLTAESVERVKMRFSLRNLPFAEVKQGSALELPFNDNEFDIVFSHGVLHHIPEIKSAQKEISRVLKPDGNLIVMLYAKNSLNYLFSIFLLRRLGLIGLYYLKPNIGGIYGHHIAQAREKGLWNYLKMDNFINVNTDGPFNPYSKVYNVNEVKKEFTDFEVIETHQDFMHAPPLRIGWLPLAKWLGWHLWARMRIK
ncbi:MAG: class I SAM-dependent methyltransferase [Pyrinomonadaceae bacterium]|nr:class I SAM-dependent methyltransferase [Pyrinomonadaceae bacterium]